MKDRPFTIWPIMFTLIFLGVVVSIIIANGVDLQTIKPTMTTTWGR